ncbi:Alw26I/Eco31I/Esp3I family type II restriction adenine-specific DNA-methyltransferase [Sanyastnella coralliicola]|uniref:Alw26I/Eco31I/Esp3I family type II restriction adenine-specific DNA-methyltransferase n=1 Tax=Sanyastnella coralliicola TaxID=3069118 RepID=UPI0027B8C539|nr:Alw26I/Eco31I/Esp3I family type II restriction adenine-specific DNA-methyltransferase [Longitalea sp. SCSIO 12813]
MEHLEHIKDTPNATNLKVKLSGKYYTHHSIASHGIRNLIGILKNEGRFKSRYTVCDPFAGDGRLVFWFLEKWAEFGLPEVTWTIHLWDIEKSGLEGVREKLMKLDIDIDEINIVIQDAFKHNAEERYGFDFILTNPPWEMIKPDSRELKYLGDQEKADYISSLKAYDKYLAENYPLSQPKRKFAGWGTNLSRVGVELIRNLVSPNGFTMVVLPTSFLADDQSLSLRKELFTIDSIHTIDYYPAEAKLFGKADVDSAVLVFRRNGGKSQKVLLSKFDQELNLERKESVDLNHKIIVSSGYNLPMNISNRTLDILQKLGQHNKDWQQIEEDISEGLWAGREIDETGIKAYLVPNNGHPLFIKGRMIDRFSIKEGDFQSFNKNGWTAPHSVVKEKIVWRDVSRSSQKRRMIATIVPQGFVAGNSLGVCFYKDGSSNELRILLAILNSLCFEFQLRNNLATGHISLSSMRKTKIPSRVRFHNFGHLAKLVGKQLEGGDVEAKIDAYVAKIIYGLDISEYSFIVDTFQKLSVEEKETLMREHQLLEGINTDGTKVEIKIYNHLSSTLSEMDLTIVKSVPPGGNWKDIPEDVPSKRVQTIRAGYKAGKGSRSTYYGRLLPNMPSYTINTYLNRPGNGCHIHYNQDRVISQREAARFQSFPDSFEFIGSQQSINTQIGNAVPPLLAYQVALQISEVIGTKGVYVDLFSGAGGMGLGFKWAGWKPLFANDIEKRFLETYARNVHDDTILGSITDHQIFDTLVQKAFKFKEENKRKPFWILGGPPCQGFSTAGKKRTMEDPRNLLFRDYTKFLTMVQPDGFVFENVSGLLNMDKGKVFQEVKKEFKKVISHVDGFVLQSEHYAIPQRRKRVFLIGQRQYLGEITPPAIITKLDPTKDLFNRYKQCISASDALSDLPSLIPGQNGDTLDYVGPPVNSYQRLMRGLITAKEYIREFG